MPFDTYERLLTALESWTDRGDQSCDAGDFIRLAELEVQRELRMRFVEKETTGAMVTDSDEITWPTDLLEPLFLRLDTSPLRYLKLVSFEKLTDVDNNQGSWPAFMTNLGLKAKVAPTPTGNHAYTVYYRAGITPLSETVTSNWLTDNAPDVLFFSALKFAAMHADDPEMQKWEKEFRRALRSFKAEEFRARTGGGSIRVRPDTFA